MKDVIIKKGKNPGPISVILAGVHGNEKCGVNAFNKMLPKLEIGNGIVYFIYANPQAIKDDVRYIDSNLNRLFRDEKLLTQEEKRSYEYQRMLFIKKYLDEAHALLDIHASNNPKSKAFIICEENALPIASQLSIKTITTGFDTLEPGGTDGYMYQNNKIGMCVECGYSKDPSSDKIAEKSILEFLSAQGHTQKIDMKKQEKEVFHMNFLYHTKTHNFKLNKSFDDFEKIKKGQIIGTDGDREILSPIDGIILFAHNRDTIGAEAFLCGVKKPVK